MHVPPLFLLRLPIAGFLLVVLTGSVIVGDQAVEYQKRADRLAGYERHCRAAVQQELAQAAGRDPKAVANYRVRARRYAEIANYYASLKQKYERASWQPWMDVPPDPTAPTL